MSEICVKWHSRYVFSILKAQGAEDRRELQRMHRSQYHMLVQLNEIHKYQKLGVVDFKWDAGKVIHLSN